MPSIIIDNLILTGAAILLVVVLTIVSVIAVRKIKTAKPIDTERVENAFGQNNVTKIAFIRNKINVTVKNLKEADMEALKTAGAVGINIVGNKVKFYFEKDNEFIYEALKEHFDKS